LNERLSLLLLRLLTTTLRPLFWSVRDSSPGVQYLIVIQPRPYSTHHLLNLIAR